MEPFSSSSLVLILKLLTEKIGQGLAPLDSLLPRLQEAGGG